MTKSASLPKQVTVITLSGEKGSVMTCSHTNRKMSFVTQKDGSVEKTYICKLCDASLPIDEGNFSIDAVRSIGFGVGTMPTRHPGSQAVEAREKRWEKDMPAYKRMRQQGLQPKTIDGSAHIEAKAETRFEVESGQVLPGQAKKIETAVNAIESITGKSVYAPDTKPVNL